jgi:hypothetical protein
MRTSCTYATIYKCYKWTFPRVSFVVAIFADGRTVELFNYGSVDTHVPTRYEYRFSLSHLFFYSS